MPAIPELLNQGLAAQRAGRLDEAQKSFEAALATEPQNAAAMRLLGTVMAQRRDFVAAETWLFRAVALAPDDAGAHHHLARVLSVGGRRQEALSHSEQAARLKPADARVRLQRANLLHDLGRHEEALADYDFAITRLPADAGLHYRRGRALAALWRHAEALETFDRAMALRPDNQIRIAAAVMLHQLRRIDEALGQFRQAAAQDPDNAALQMALAHLSLEAGEDEAAVAAFDRAYLLSPTLPLLAGNRRYAKLRIGDWRDYDADHDAILAGNARGEVAAPGLATVESDPAQQQAAARLYAPQAIPTMPPLWRGEIYNHARLRIAYVSKDFREHATMVLAGAMFESHDRACFETFAISLAAERGTAGRARAEAAFEHFHHAEAMSNQAVAELIRRLEIDIAVDLDGLTMHARNAIFGYRPAPVAVNFLGYPGTMGSPHYDYIIADRIVVPEDEERFYDEKVIAMPVTYQPNTARPETAATPLRRAAGLPDTGFVFCCFNAAHKITPPIFDLWMRLLCQIEGSVLWLLESTATLRSNLRHEALARGIAPERLVFAPRVKLPEHLARHALADLFLDTLPFNAHTTASDALWCGLPVLTCKGHSFAGRVAASLNHAIGMDAMTVTSLADYEVLALSLARDPARLAALKAGLSASRDTSALFDIQNFTRQIEAAYRTMWEQHEAGRAT